VAADLGYGDSFIPAYRYAMLDDHTPFARLGIPAVDIIDFDYPYWHTTNDTIDKVDAQSLARVGRTLEAFLENSGEPGGTHD
jgi:glutaminyl-peptide cyclotransferase